MHTTANQVTKAGNSQTTNSTESLSALSMASNEFHKFLADIEDLVKAATSLTGEDLAKAKVQLNERIATAKESLADVSNSVANKAKKAAHISNNYVHDQPWQVIGAGSVIGFLLGVMIARRA